MKDHAAVCKRIRNREPTIILLLYSRVVNERKTICETFADTLPLQLPPIRQARSNSCCHKRFEQFLNIFSEVVKKVLKE